MNDHDKFDDYIKSLLDKEPEVPAKLKWEEMDFDLPDTDEQQTKPDRKKYLGLLLLLLIVVAIVYFSIDKEKIAVNQHPPQTQEQAIESESVSNIPSHTNKIEFEDTSTLNHSEKNTSPSKPVLSSEKIVSSSVIHNVKSAHQTASTPKSIRKENRLLTTNKPSPVTTFENTIPSNTMHSKDDFIGKKSNNNISQNVTQINDNNYEAIKTNPLSAPISATKSSQKSIQLSTETLSAIPINLPVNNEVELLPNPVLSEMNYADKASNFRLEEVFVGYGLNNFNSTIEDSNPLKDKVNKAVGNSIRAGARFRLNNNWQTNIQLKYDRYHSTFEHIRALDTLYRSDGIRLYRIYRYEETYHNNYTSTLGAQLSVERKWQVAKRLQLYAGLGITPTYTISADGKTTTETLVEKLVFSNEFSRFSVNGNLSAGMIIPISKSISIEAAYQHNRFLLNDIFINNGIQTNQQNTVSLMISYRLTPPAN